MLRRKRTIIRNQTTAVAIESQRDCFEYGSKELRSEKPLHAAVVASIEKHYREKVAVVLVSIVGVFKIQRIRVYTQTNSFVLF